MTSVRYIEFLRHLIYTPNALVILVKHASFDNSKQARDFVRVYPTQQRIFFLPKQALELNPDEQGKNKIKNNH